MTLSMRKEASRLEADRYDVQELCAQLGMPERAAASRAVLDALAAAGAAPPPELRASATAWPEPRLEIIARVSDARSVAAIEKVLSSLPLESSVDAQRLEQVWREYADLGSGPLDSALVRVSVGRGKDDARLELGLDFQGTGEARAAAVAEETLCRLGRGQAWPVIARSLVGPSLGQIQRLFFSVSASPPSVEVQARGWLADGGSDAAGLESADLVFAVPARDGAPRLIARRAPSAKASDSGEHLAVRLSPAETMEHFEHTAPITIHPLMRRLRREAVNLGHLWTLLANFQISISKNFARRLAYIASRVEDETIRCILAVQLNDEMGEGKPERAHVRLFANMMQQLAPFAPRASAGRDMLAPGRRLDAKLAAIYGAENTHESVGAVMVGEVFGKQMDAFLADEFRRQSDIDPKSLEWVMLHEQLEIEHADSSNDLAALFPPEAHEAAWRGSRALFMAGWAFLDDVYAECFGNV